MTTRPISQMVSAVLMLAGAVVFSNKATADSLTYNTGSNLGWFATDAWIGPDTWQSGDSATIVGPGSTTTIAYTEDTAITDLTVNGTGAVFITSVAAQSLTFSGGTMNVGNPNGFQTAAGASIQGNFELTGPSSGLVRLGASAVAAAYSGTATLSGARFEWSLASHVGSNSHFIIEGGTLQNRDSSTSTIGTVELNSGSFELGRNNNDGNNSTTIVSRLSGSGGAIVSPSRSLNPSLTLVRTLTVNQSADTTFSGTIAGVNAGARIVLNKQGVGDLRLAGEINLARQTSVTGGALYISGTNATFTNELVVGGNAISVDGATLGGLGTLVISGGDNVALSSTGRLAAGEEGVIGRTTFNFIDGGNLDISAATAGSATGWLAFDLGSDASAGITFDQISLTEGIFQIGSGLNFSDFAFTTQSGFAPGEYMLVATADGISGSLGVTEGLVGGYESSLEISGNNLILTVVPEPQAIALILGSAGLLFVLRRRSGCRSF